MLFMFEANEGISPSKQFLNPSTRLTFFPVIQLFGFKINPKPILLFYFSYYYSHCMYTHAEIKHTQAK